MKYLILYSLVLVIGSCAKNTPKYDEQIQELINTYDINQMDSLSHTLIGSQLSKYEWFDINGKNFLLGESGKPIYLQATASWCKPCAAMLPALNDMAEKYGDQVDFILISFDRNAKAQKYKSRLHNNIRLIPSTMETNPNDIKKVVAGDFTHIFPFPTTYFLTPDRIIQNIEIGGPIPADDTETEHKIVYEHHTESIGISLNELIQ